MRMSEFIKIIIIYFCSLQYVHAHYNQDSSEEVVSQADSPINLIRAYAITKNRSCENDTNTNNNNDTKEQNSYVSKIQENIGSRFKTAIKSVKKTLPKTGQENFVDMAQAYFHSNAQKSANGGSETVGESSGQENNARWIQTQIDSRNQKSGGSGSEMVNESGGKKNSASRAQTSRHSNDQNLENGGVQENSQSNKQEAKYTQYHDSQQGYYASAIGSENFQNQQGYVASVDGSKNDQNRYRYGGLVGGSGNVQNQQGYAASVDGSKNGQIQYRYDDSASSSENGQNEYASIRKLQNQQDYVASVDGLKYDSANGSRYDQSQYRYNNSVNGSRYDQNRYRYDASANGLRYDQNRYRYDASVNGLRYDQNWYRYNNSVNGSTTIKAMYQCNSCPTSLAVVSGSETINQYPGTNQYNCSDITLQCANPSGGGVSFQFYYNGSLVIYDNKCGVNYETVMCSTEGYQWVTVNNQYYKVDSVQCSYPNNTCNSTSNTQSPPITAKSAPSWTNTYSSDQDNYTDFEKYDQEWNGTVKRRHRNKNERKHYKDDNSTEDSFFDKESNSIERTAWLNDKNRGRYKNYIHNENSTDEGYFEVEKNSTDQKYWYLDKKHEWHKNDEKHERYKNRFIKEGFIKNENFDGEANSIDQKSWRNNKNQKWTNGKNSMDLSNEEKRFWAEVKNFEDSEGDNSTNVKSWLRGKNFGWHKNHHKDTDKSHFDEETNDTRVHVELREWYKNHFRDEHSTGDEVRNSNDQRPWLRGDRHEKEYDFDNKLSRDRWDGDGNFEKEDDNSAESEYWGRRNKSKTRKFADLTQNIDRGNVDGQKLSAYENMYKNFVSDKRDEINIPLYYPDGKHLGQMADGNSRDMGFDKKEYQENSNWHQNSTHKNFSWFNSPPEKSINWTVSLSGGIKAKFWLNENNRSSNIIGIKKPLVIVTVDHETNNQTNLTQADRLQIYRAWYRESINIINERESGNRSCQVSKYRDNMFCYPGPRLDTSNASSSIIYCDDIQQKYENAVGEIDEFMKILSNTTDLVAYLKNTSISSIRNILQTEKEKISQMIVIMENTKAEADLNKKLCMVTELINILPEEGINASNYEIVKVEIDNFANKYFNNWTVNLDDVVMQLLG